MLMLVVISSIIASCVLFSKALDLADPVRNDFPLPSLLPPKSCCYLHPQEKLVSLLASGKLFWVSNWVWLSYL